MTGGSTGAEGSQRGTAEVFKMRGEMQLEKERQAKLVSYRWKQLKGGG